MNWRLKRLKKPGRKALASWIVVTLADCSALASRS